MSKETIEWLNKNTMIGNTAAREAYSGSGWVMFDEKDGTNKAWWHRDYFQNGYEGPIPAEEITRVLFNWEPIESEIMHKVRHDQNGEELTPEMADGVDGIGPFMYIPDEKRKGIIHPTTEHVFGIFGIDSYKIHGYNQWLLDNVQSIVDNNGLGFGTAGLLREGGVAYVTAELPENVTVAGMDIRPQILACTSVDGTKATTYKLTTNVVVCDNSLDLAIRDKGAAMKVKHSSKSLNRLADAQEALGILFDYSADMEKLISGLADVDITDKQFREMTATFKPVPTPEVEGDKVKNQRSITVAENVNNELFNLWRTDPRCADWHGTLLGAFQSFNTYANHYRPQSEIGPERTMAATISGDIGKADAEFFSIVKGMGVKVPEKVSELINV